MCVLSEQLLSDTTGLEKLCPTKFFVCPCSLPSVDDRKVVPVHEPGDFFADVPFVSENISWHCDIGPDLRLKLSNILLQQPVGMGAVSRRVISLNGIPRSTAQARHVPSVGQDDVLFSRNFECSRLHTLDSACSPTNSAVFSN